MLQAAGTHCEITGHLHRNMIITDARHSFGLRCSYETQLILTVEELAGEINKGGQTDIILLNFSKGFDKVLHKRLLFKVDFYGIRGKTKRWTQDFFSNRTQQVAVEGKHSYTGSGIPQVSVLGPFLFLIYIKDQGDGIKSRVCLTPFSAQSDPQPTPPNYRMTSDHWSPGKGGG